MKRNISKAISIVLAICMVFSGLPLLAGSLDVNAASVTKKKITLKATVYGKTTVKLKWNKVKSPGKGYAVFRDGKVIKRLSTKKTAFTDKGLKPGTKHKYQIKTYTKKKVTKWYNKKTGKWQKKKPAKKYCGKSKKVWTYIYKKKSNIVRVKTKSSVKESQPSDQDDSNTDPDKTTGDTGNDGSDKTSTDDSAKSSYTYKIHILSEPYGGTSEVIMAVYVETNNPSVQNYELGILDSNNQTKKLNVSKAYYKGSNATTTYEDLELPINSGYLAICRPECTGNCTLFITEYNDDGESIAASKKIYIKDYYTEEAAWRQSVINQVTDSSMTNKEKMNAICQYLLNNFKYTKIPDGTIPNVSPECHYIILLADAGTPYWIEKRLNSYTSPALLVKFGQDIGYSLHNCYNDYTEGSVEWKNWHMKAYSEADDEYYSACPQYTTGYIDTSRIVMFDPDTYKFWGE